MKAKIVADYVIVNTDDPSLYWGWDAGWGRLETADHYYYQDTKIIRLPMGGRWVIDGVREERTS